MAEPDTRRTIEKLMADVAAARPLINRTYRHHGTGDLYSLLFVAFDERTNETQAVFGLCALPALKFTCPLDKFRDSFEEDHGTPIAK